MSDHEMDTEDVGQYMSYYDDRFIVMELEKASSLAGELLGLHNRIKIAIINNKPENRRKYQKELDRLTRYTNIEMWRFNVRIENQIRDELARLPS